VADPELRYFEGRDGARLAYREIGAGRPLVLLHGFFSTATVNWIRYGHAERIAARGFRVVMPDLRAHGDSAASHDPAAYPPDVLTDDGLALVDHLGVGTDGAADYDVAGYSLGGRTVARMLVRGATPGRAVVAGMGLENIVGDVGGGSFHHILTNLGTFARGTPEWRSEQFLRSVGNDPQALLLLLGTNVRTPIEELETIRTETLVLMGTDDDDHGSGRRLAAVIPGAGYEQVPGTHMSAVAKPQLGVAIADFLAGVPVAEG
jgi:pimeloyl-ACP methyl ester carboxylesterase